MVGKSGALIRLGSQDELGFTKISGLNVGMKRLGMKKPWYENPTMKKPVYEKPGMKLPGMKWWV